MEDTALYQQQLHQHQLMMMEREGEKENQSSEHFDTNASESDVSSSNWSSRGSGSGNVRTKSSPKKEKGGGKQHQQKKSGTAGGGDQAQAAQRNTVLLLIDDEKVKPIEVDLFCKTYPKEHEAFTSAFLRQNDFARKIFAGGDRLLKWYFQEDHLTFPRLCLIYQNRCSQGRTNPWVPKLIRNGPALRGPVVLVQQKKSPNAETVVFDQYRREDRHMLPAAASFLATAHVSCGELPTRTSTTPAVQRAPMRASAPSLSLKASTGGGRTAIMVMDDGVQPQHPYLSSSFSPTAPPYSVATLSSLPSSPSSSSPSSGSSSRGSSPSNTPPSSVPHSPRSSFSSGSMFATSSTTATRPGAAPPSFPTPQQSDGAVNLSGSLSALPPFTSPHFYSPPLSSGGAAHHEPSGFDSGLVERPTIGNSNGGIPVSRSADEFSAFSSQVFPYSLWSYPASAATHPPSTAPGSHHHQHSYSADGMLTGQHSLPPHHAQHQALAQSLSLSTSGVYVPSRHQYRSTSLTPRQPARHFSWEGPLEKPTRVISGPEVLRATYPSPAPLPSAGAAAAAAASRRTSFDSGSAREGIDEHIVGQLKKIRDSPALPTKVKATRLAHTYEEFVKTREASAPHGDGAKRRSSSGTGKPLASPVTHKTKLFCRTLLFEARVAHANEKCDDDMRGKRSMAKWEELMRTEVRDMLADGLVDTHLVDRILLACFVQRRVQTARDLVREIAKQAPKAVSREDWATLADSYEAFSPWLSAFMRRIAAEGAEVRPTDINASETRVTLRIIRRRTFDDDEDDEEMFRTIAPLAATVDELKHKLWQEQSRQVAEGGDDRHLLRPNDMGVLYRFKRGAEVHLQGQDILQDFLLPPTEPGDDQKLKMPEKDDARKARNGRPEPTPYDIVVIDEPRLLAFAHFPDLARNLTELKGMIDSEERDLWNNHVGQGRVGSHGGMLYDYLCHHFEYLDEQNRRAVRRERKERQRRKERALLRDERQKKDAENGYRDHQGRKEKRIEAELHGQRNIDEDGLASYHAPKYIVRYLAALTMAEEPATFLTAAERRDKQLGGRRVEHCSIHLGSLTKEDEEPLYAVFTRNPEWPYASHQRWTFHAWTDEFSLIEKYGLSSSSVGRSSSSSSTSRTIGDLLPSPPRYFGSVQDLYMVPGVKIYLNAEHVLKTKANCKKFDQCAYSKHELAFVSDSARRANLDFALARCLRSLRNDPSLAVPQSRADASGVFHLEFLVPVYVRSHKFQKPDLVLALERRYDGEGRLSCYVATTFLTLAQAYANARRVKKIRQSWLSAACSLGSKNQHGNGSKRNHKTKRSHEEDEDEDEEFKFEAEIEKWVSETEGEESEDTEEDSSDSTASN